MTQDTISLREGHLWALLLFGVALGIGISYAVVIFTGGDESNQTYNTLNDSMCSLSDECSVITESGTCIDKDSQWYGCNFEDKTCGGSARLDLGGE